MATGVTEMVSGVVDSTMPRVLHVVTGGISKSITGQSSIDATSVAAAPVVSVVVAVVNDAPVAVPAFVFARCAATTVDVSV